MTLTRLAIHQFRNIRAVEFDCATRLNLIVGANAAGKTSLLEAIYFLSRVRSFRSSHVRELITSGSQSLRVSGEIDYLGRRLPVGVERSIRSLNARIGGQQARSLAEITRHMPLLLLNPDSHRLLEDGPSERRRLMDWGLFHIDTDFLPVWRRYRTALKNRNAALRQSSPDREIAAWETDLVASANQLDAQRQAFCAQLDVALTPLLEAMSEIGAVRIDYRRGWPQGQELAELLSRDRFQEKQLGYTRHGPHRADFIARLGDLQARPPAVERLSRGQQKLLVVALTLTLADLYRRHHGEACMLLIDDLPAELDTRHRARITAVLARQPLQLFVTALEPDLLDTSGWTADTINRFVLTNGELGKML